MSLDLELYIIAYRLPEKTQKAIDTFRETGGHDVKITVFDNSPTPTEFTGIDAYYHFPFNASLTRVWNWAIGMAKTRWVCISNTDITFAKGWREAFENTQHMKSSKLHNRFYCFFLDRSLVRLVGWFDERMTKIYWEDTDYVRRVVNAGLPWCSDCGVTPFITNTHPPYTDDIWNHYFDNEELRKGVQTPRNLDFYKQKWGDDNHWPNAGGQQLIPEINWYPCADLPPVEW